MNGAKKARCIAILACSSIMLTACDGGSGRPTFSSVDHKVELAQDTLDTYGFDVDASELSIAQVSALAFLSVNTDIGPVGRAEAKARNSIRAILN
jgi:hypothetical protein